MNTTLIIILYIIVFIWYFQQSRREGIMAYKKIKKFIENNIKHRSHNTWDWGYGHQDKGDYNKSNKKKYGKNNHPLKLILLNLDFLGKHHYNGILLIPEYADIIHQLLIDLLFLPIVAHKFFLKVIYNEIEY